MIKKFVIAVLAMAILVISAVVYMKHQQAEAAQYEQEQRQKQRERAQGEARILQDIALLKAAPEAVNVVPNSGSLILNARRDMLQILGTDWIYPYMNQRRPRAMSTSVIPEEARSIPSVFLGGEYDGGRIRSFVVPANRYESDESIEWTMESDAGTACRDISFILRYPKDCAASQQYLSEHPNLWPEEIRPRLLVLTNASSRGLALAACDALVAGGDRSPVLREALTAFAQRLSDDDREHAVALLKECGWSVPAQWRTLDELPSLTEGVAPTTSKILPTTALRCIGRETLGSSSQPGDQPDETGTPTAWRDAPDLLYVGEKGKSFIAAKARGESVVKLWQVDLHTGAIKPLSLGSAKYKNVQAAAVSPDGLTLVTYNQPIAKGSNQPVPAWFTVWDLQRGEAITELPGPRPGKSRAAIPTWITFSDTGNHLLIQGASFDVYDTGNWNLLWKMPLRLDQPPAFLPIKRLRDANDINSNTWRTEAFAFVGIEQGAVRIWSDIKGMSERDVNRCRVFSAVAVAHQSPTIAAFSSSPRKLIQWPVDSVSTIANQVNVSWPTSHSLALIGDWRVDHCGPERAVFSPNDGWLITIQPADNDLIVWTRDGYPIGRITGHQAPVRDMRFAGDRLITTSDDTTILVWDWPALRAMCEQRLAATATQEQ